MSPPPEPARGASGTGSAAPEPSGGAPRVRFAPSPSGYLHIGGARTALFNWLWARRRGGTFVLRIEDTDQERSHVESVRAILDALRWLGLDWDEGPEAGGAHGPYFQSERRARYREVADAMVEAGTAYRCYATKEELEQARAELKARDPKAQFVYPGWWRDRRDWPEGKSWVYRFKTPRTGATDFDDLVFGRVSTPNEAQQDFVLMRSDGFPLYNFSCVIDDHDMGITLVARGRDHIGNTPQQVLLYEALGWPLPELAHLPMMLSPKGEKLSKRHAAVSVSEYRERGYTAMGVLNYLARFGWSHGDQEIFARDELIAAFDWAAVNRADGKFDEKKFADVAFEHLKQPRLTGDAEYAGLVRPFLAARGLAVDEPKLLPALPLVRERARTLADAAHHLDFYFREPPELEPAAARSLAPASAELLEGLAAALGAVEPWEAPAIDAAIRSWVEARGVSMKDVAQPARVALSGRAASPALHDVMAVLGQPCALARLRRGAALAREAAGAQAPG